MTSENAWAPEPISQDPLAYAYPTGRGLMTSEVPGRPRNNRENLCPDRGPGDYAVSTWDDTTGCCVEQWRFQR